MFRLFSLALLALTALSVHAEESAEMIVKKMVARDKELVQHRSIYKYTVEMTREKLDDDGKVLSSSHEEMQMQGDKSPDYDTRKNKDVEGNLKQAAREEPFNILHILSHYDFKLDGNENVGGTPCIKVRFTPKGNQPYSNREEKVANELEGYLWISKADYSLVRNSGRLTKPVSIGWIFATMKELEFLFQARLLPNGELGPSQIQYRFLVQIMFLKVHERHTRVMKDYKVSQENRYRAADIRSVASFFQIA